MLQSARYTNVSGTCMFNPLFAIVSLAMFLFLGLYITAIGGGYGAGCCGRGRSYSGGEL